MVSYVSVRLSPSAMPRNVGFSSISNLQLQQILRYSRWQTHNIKCFLIMAASVKTLEEKENVITDLFQRLRIFNATD